MDSAKYRIKLLCKNNRILQYKNRKIMVKIPNKERIRSLLAILKPGVFCAPLTLFETIYSNIILINSKKESIYDRLKLF